MNLIRLELQHATNALLTQAFPSDFHLLIEHEVAYVVPDHGFRVSMQISRDKFNS